MTEPKVDHGDLLDAIFNSGDISIFVVTVLEDGGFTIDGINPTHEALMGIKSSDLAGKRPEEVVDVIGQEAVDYIYSVYGECVEKRDRIHSEFYHPMVGAAQGWWSVMISPIMDSNTGRVIRLVGTGTMITEHKETEAALRESEERMRGIFEATGEYILVLDREHRIIDINRTVPDLNKDDVIGSPVHNFLPAGDRARVAKTLNEVFETGEQRRYTTVYTDEDGNQAKFTSLASPIDRSGEVVSIVVSSRDITEWILLEEERDRLQAQYLQAQKMEAVGRLAGGVAHDFNNLLAAIRGNAALALDDLGTENTPVREALEEIRKASKRATEVTRQLLAFSRKQVSEPRVVDLNALVNNLDTMLTRLIGEKVILRTETQAALHGIRVDPGQLEQVVVNLVINARDAMPNGGNLRLATNSVTLGAEFCAPTKRLTPGPHAMISVTDEGVGMTEEVRENIFEPFFTTKAPGQGTGLGLATVFGIVEQNGGSIDVATTPGKGSTFKVYFPQVSEPIEALGLPSTQRPSNGP
jgi:two-component system, cell cycle sensor histidine kinase and response regulator CckA